MLNPLGKNQLWSLVPTRRGGVGPIFAVLFLLSLFTSIGRFGRLKAAWQGGDWTPVVTVLLLAVCVLVSATGRFKVPERWRRAGGSAGFGVLAVVIWLGAFAPMLSDPAAA